MIKVTVAKDKEGRYTGFKCEGHAGYAEAGNDVICAAVSILAINTVNSVESLAGIDMDVESDQKKGLIKAVFKDKLNEKAEVLMDAFVLGISSIEKQYGKDYVTYTEITDL